MSKSQQTKELALSYLELRRIVGIIGICLPPVLAVGNILLGNDGLESTISAYYHSDMGDVLVGSLFAIAVFMIAYRGWGKQDKRVGDLAGIGAIGVALFPVMPESANTAEPTLAEYVCELLHAGFAAVFFLSLAYFCLVLFRKTAPGTAPTAQKRKRNTVYGLCGWLIVSCVALIGLQYFILDSPLLTQYKFVFWLESLAIFAFGISWFVKGEGILRD